MSDETLRELYAVRETRRREADAMLRARVRRLSALIRQTAAGMVRSGREEEGRRLAEGLDLILTTDADPSDLVVARPSGGAHE